MNANATSNDPYVVTTVKFPRSIKKRLDDLAREIDPVDPNTSSVVRDIVADYFARMARRAAQAKQQPVEE